jgi:hypothetical protein
MGKGLRGTGPVWAASAVLVVLAATLLLLVQDPRYFFHGDTQSAYLGWEFRLGEQLRSGRWPLIDLHAWASGNAVAEGQWALFNPLVAAIGLLATTAQNVLVFATAVKVTLACVGVLGTFALSRSYGAAAPLAFVAAVAAVFGGMTQYLDLASWTAGLMIWALVPWVWWALRRTMFGAANPAVLLVLVYLLVTVGYVYGTIMLGLVLVVSLVDARVCRDREAGLRVVGAGALGALVACTVYLPGVLTAPVTIRSGGAFHLTGKFATDPLALLASPLPTDAVPGTTLHLLPYAFVAWFLPVLVLVDVGAVRRRWQPLAGLLLFTAVMVLVVVAMPQQVGPLRWPLRLQPFLVQGVVVLTAVLLSRHVVRRPSRRRLALGLCWLGLAGLVAAVRAPTLWPGHLLALVGAAGGFVAVWWCLGRPGAVSLRSGAVGAAGLTLVLGLLQHVVLPEPPSPERNMPALAQDYRRPLPAAQGDVMVVGDTGTALQDDPAWARESLSGSAWYLGSHRVQNGYTTINFRAYRDRYCIDYDGSTCPRLLDELFSAEPTTGRRRVDLLSVGTLLLVRADFPDRDLTSPPAGWRVAASTPRTVTWVRRTPAPGAASPVWTSPGTTVVTRSGDDRSVRFTVRRVPAGGGRVVMSAMAWPGFATDVGRVAKPVDGYLLTVDLPADAAGRTVTVRYSPPGWHLELTTLGLALLGGIAWCGAFAVTRRRRR